MSENVTDMRAAKLELREKVRAFRTALTKTPDAKKHADGSIVAFAAAYARGLSNPNPRIAAYSPLPNEPGGASLLDALASQSSTILLPIVEPHGVLKWAAYRGPTDLAAGPLGVSQPTGARFNSNVLNTCDVIFLPAMSVDRAGNRLGKGRGYYDTALRGLRAEVPKIAFVYDEDVVDTLPADEFDVRIDAVITPSGFSEFSR